MSWFNRLINKFPNKRTFKFLKQRMTRGFDDSETWSLDHSLAKTILPRLKRFQIVRGGHPIDLTEEKWNWIIDEMIFGFEFYAEGKQWDYGPNQEKESERAGKALEMFGKYYGNLWW